MTKNAAYLTAVHDYPCCICEAFGEAQTTPTEAHHVICGRYSFKKTPDIMAIPLCDGHHQGMFDTSKTAIHRGKETWVAKYGLDTDYVAAMQDKLAHLIKDRERDCQA